MRNTVQVQRNGGTKSHSRQHHQISRTKKPVENLYPVSPQEQTGSSLRSEIVRIVTQDDDAKKPGWFKISNTKRVAMQKDAKSKGISLMQWIEDAVKTKLSA